MTFPLNSRVTQKRAGTVIAAEKDGKIEVRWDDGSAQEIETYRVDRLETWEKSWPTAIDPMGCGCTECITGEYVPYENVTDETWLRFIRGEVVNHTGLSDYLLVPNHIELPREAKMLRGDWHPYRQY